MAVDRYFFIVIFVASVLIGGFLIARPETAEASIPPYLWLLGCMLIFEMIAFLRGRGAPGTMVGMSTRVIGFAIGMAIILAIVFFSGSPARLF
ncbi:MAG TPA: hypothetical protein VNR41_01170 [Xanthobacteraceae bacterium]|jgi:hypothetical protein|nr:hypothetical protein [Xanthobacteraceae bacterium]